MTSWFNAKAAQVSILGVVPFLLQQWGQAADVWTLLLSCCIVALRRDADFSRMSILDVALQMLQLHVSIGAV